ncbi:hypothetical protein Sango_0925600 [Sesamum angolense]|uniref:Uncharacterized protein n=1 Tax=Sesamum angolense TaxID=2727404 RepID=A0AAE1WYY8_9LAMI|nr:hypothetical protein Sango_0925600 [Sesamum angolense]
MLHPGCLHALFSVVDLTPNFNFCGPFENFRLLNGLHYGNLQYANGIESFKQPSPRVGLSIKASGKIKSALFFGEEGTPHSAGSNVSSNALVSDLSSGVEVQSDSVVLGALPADMAPTTSGFPNENDEFDLDLPSEGFSHLFRRPLKTFAKERLVLH